jgi:uncharacterized protein with PhoU and TrkA domain
VIVLAVKKKDGSLIMNPSSDTRIETSDILIALGTASQIDSLSKIVGGGV